MIVLLPCPKLCKSQNRFQFEVIIAAMDDGSDLGMTEPTHLVRREGRMTRAVVTGRLHSVAECLRLLHCVADSGHGAHTAEPKTIQRAISRDRKSESEIIYRKLSCLSLTFSP